MSFQDSILIIIFFASVILFGCKKEGEDFPALKVSFVCKDVSINGGNDGKIYTTVEGGKPPYFYQWSNGSTEKDLCDLSAGNFIITVNDDAGQTIMDTAVISEPQVLAISGTVIDVSSIGLQDGSIDITIKGGVFPYSIIWSTGDSIEDLFGLPMGEYIVNVYDINGAYASDTFTILARSADINIDFICTNVSIHGGKDGSIEAIVSGGAEPYDFLWSNNANQSKIYSLESGTYTLIVTDHLGFKTSASVTITEPDPLIIQHEMNQASGPENADGSITINVLGGVSPYLYSWSDGVTAKDREKLLPGEYIIEVTDDHGAIKTDTIMVTTIPEEPAELNIEFLHKNVSVNGGSDGFIIATISGGIPPYQYLWSNGETTKDLVYVTAGEYQLEVTDSEENKLKKSITLTEPDPLAIGFDKTDCSSIDNPDGAIDITVTGGVKPYHYSWSNGEVNEDIEQLSPGLYNLIVTDDHGATKSISINIALMGDYVADVDGNVYSTVKIGEQIWLGENLKVAHNPDGNPIDRYCYNDNSTNCENFGGLYTWDVVMNGSTAEESQGICPEGWHVPSDQEWMDLEVFLGMSAETANLENTWRGTDEGTKLKAGGSAGMNLLLSGRRSSAGSYSLLNAYEYQWTSTDYGDNAWRRCFRSTPDIGRWNTFPKTYAFSVRCIKDH